MLLNCGVGGVPWTTRRSNQSILKEISPKYSLEGLMLKLQYFGHLMQRANSLEKTLMLGKIEGRRRGRQRTDGWMTSPTQWTWVWASSGRWWRTGEPGVLHGVREAWYAAVHGVAKSQTRLSDWTTTTTRDYPKRIWFYLKRGDFCNCKWASFSVL